jgi:hypothetical protein
MWESLWGLSEPQSGREWARSALQWATQWEQWAMQWETLWEMSTERQWAMQWELQKESKSSSRRHKWQTRALLRAEVRALRATLTMALWERCALRK